MVHTASPFCCLQHFQENCNTEKRKESENDNDDNNYQQGPRAVASWGLIVRAWSRSFMPPRLRQCRCKWQRPHPSCPRRCTLYLGMSSRSAVVAVVAAAVLATAALTSAYDPSIAQSMVYLSAAAYCSGDSITAWYALLVKEYPVCGGAATHASALAPAACSNNSR